MFTGSSSKRVLQDKRELGFKKFEALSFLMVYIVENVSFIHAAVKKLSLEGRGNKCLILGGVPQNIRDFLSEKSVEVIRRPEYTVNEREAFLKEYIDFIGSLSLEQNNLLWWATDISSKNRFTSNLSELLQQYVESIKMIKAANYEQLIILNPLGNLFPTLQNFLREHNLNYQYFGNPLRMWFSQKLYTLRKIISLVYNGIKIYVRSLYARLKLRAILKKKFSRDRQYYVIKTFIYNSSFTENGRYRDAFFGPLPEFLKGRKDLLIFSNVLGGYRYCVNQIKECQSFLIVPFEACLSLSDVVTAVGQVLFGQITFRKEHFFFQQNVSGIVNSEMQRTFKGIQIVQLLHYKATENLLRKIHAETFLLSYENNPWEKMCMLALRKNSPRTRIIAYQHNVIPQASANMFGSRAEGPIIPMPDLILTTGEIPKRLIERHGYLNGTRIGASCALRHEYLFRAPMSQHNENRTILLALEGIFDAYKLVNFVLEELQGNTRYQIVIRTHPVLPVHRFQHKLNVRLGSLDNVHLSKGASLRDDIERADIVMYWGSTVGMEALWMGKPVIHYDMGHALSYDPLFECDHLKWKVSQGDSLAAVLRTIESLSEAQVNEQKEKAKAYLTRYFYPNSAENLRQFDVSGA